MTSSTVQSLLPIGMLSTTLILTACTETMPQVNLGDLLSGQRTASMAPAPVAPVVKAAPVLDGVDWTVVFQGLSNGCSWSPAQEALFAELRRTREKTPTAKRHSSTFSAKRVAAPYRDAVGSKVQVKATADFITFTLPVNKGSYHGLPLKGIESYGGFENGINGFTLLLGVPLPQATAALQHIRMVQPEFGEISMQAKQVGGQAMTELICDTST